MSEPVSDERLAAIEDRWTENNMIHGDIHTLIQEVRRLRGLVEDRGEAIARAGTAEAEVERLGELHERHCFEREQIAQELEAERDRYGEALEAITQLAGKPNLQIVRASLIAQAALDQQGDTLSKP